MVISHIQKNISESVMGELKYICKQFYDLSFPYVEEPRLLWTYLIKPPCDYCFPCSRAHVQMISMVIQKKVKQAYKQ